MSAAVSTAATSAASPDEAAQTQKFFEGKGLAGLPEAGPSPPAQEAPQEAPQESPGASPETTSQESQGEATPSQEGVPAEPPTAEKSEEEQKASIRKGEPDPQKAAEAWRQRKAKREGKVQELEHQLQALQEKEALANQVLQAWAQSQVQQDPNQQDLPEAEEVPDLSEDPERWVQWREEQLQSKIESLEAKLGEREQLEQQYAEHQQQVQAAQEQHRQQVAELAEAEKEWEAEYPGYQEKARHLTQSIFQDLQSQYGIDPQRAAQMTAQSIYGLVNFADQQGLHPCYVIEKQAEMYLQSRNETQGGQQAPQQQPQPRNQDLEATQKAQQSGVAGSLSQGNATGAANITVEQLKKQGIPKDYIAQVMSSGGNPTQGRKAFFELGKKLRDELEVVPSGQ